MLPQYKATKKTILALCKKWEGLIDLSWVTLEHRFSETYRDDDHLTVADTEAFWEYRAARITWYLPSVVRLDEKGIEGCLVHELVHVLLGPIERHIPNKRNEQSEFAVESVSRALISLYERKKGKKG